MKNIGGFFELEIVEGNTLYHENAIKLSTGRSCLHYILLHKKPRKVFVPYYCCDALFEPMVINNIEYEFYEINEQLEIIDLPKINNNELIVGCDFFGIKSKYIDFLISIYKEKLIIDNTHSFFKKGYKSNNPSFTSARKYFGVPDGAFLYISEKEKFKIDITRNQKISINHNVSRLIGLQEKAYTEYVEYEKSLNSDIEEISILSEKILSSINYPEVRKIRNNNFNFLSKEFKDLNQLTIDDDVKDCFCYPLLLKNPIEKEKLFKENVFISSLWLDTIGRKQNKEYNFECKLSIELLPLPIDHRYTINDMERIVKVIREYGK